MYRETPRDVTRRDFIQTSMAGAAAMALAGSDTLLAQTDQAAVVAEIARQHDATVKLLRDWIALPSIAAENLGYPQGAEYMAKLAREAGFTQVDVIPTNGKPGVFATLDNGAPTTLGDLLHVRRQAVRPAEWSSPPLEGRIVDRPGVGKVMVGRGATNTKGPQTACLAALHAFKAANRKLPINIVLVCEGEEEIGSPNFREIVFKPEVEAALEKERRHHHPPRQSVARRIRRGQPRRQGYRRARARVIRREVGTRSQRRRSLESRRAHRQPGVAAGAALNTLIKADGHTPAVDGFFDDAKPLSPQLKEILETAIPKRNEAATKKALGVQRWFEDESWHDSMVRLVTQPTINIEGLVGGYTGPGGKTILPTRAVAKVDMRLVPDMTAKGTLAKLQGASRKAGLRRHRGEHDRRLRPDRDAAGVAARRSDGARPTRSRVSIR